MHSTLGGEAEESIDHIHWLSGEKGADIGDRHPHQSGAGRLAGPGDVGRDQAIPGGEKRMAGRRWFD